MTRASSETGLPRRHGFLGSGGRDDRQDQVPSFLSGLASTGYVAGKNVVVECGWADDREDRFTSLISDMMRKQPAVLVTSTSTRTAQLTKEAVASTPVVFCIGGDPVRNGLVTSMNRPGGNLTGVSYLTNYLAPKHLEILRDLVPGAPWLGERLFPFNYVVPGQSENTLLPNGRTGGRLRHENPFSEDSYRALHFVVDLPVRIDDVLPATCCRRAASISLKPMVFR